MNFDLTTPPSWAPTWCYVYFFTALLAAAFVVVALVMGFNKMSGLTIFALLFSGALTVVDTLMYFWICRASLVVA
jgi:hypothetical protein